MKKDYFKNVLNGLGKTTSKKQIGLNFITLKSYEYWIRLLKISKKYPDADDSIGVLPKENASHILNGITAHFEQLNREEDLQPKAKKRRVRRNTNPLDEAFHGNDDEDKDKSESYRDRKIAVYKIREAIKICGSSEDIKNVTRNTLVGEDIFNGPAQKLFFDGITEELLNILNEGSDINDPYMKRLDIVQKAFHLDNVEMEILIFSWIFSSLQI